MKTKSKLDYILRPYVFLLKEGKELENNLLDYSLLLLQVEEENIFYSPRPLKRSSNQKPQLLKR